MHIINCHKEMSLHLKSSNTDFEKDLRILSLKWKQRTYPSAFSQSVRFSQAEEELD